MNLIILILLILLIFGGLPQAGWHNYGYYPSGGAGLILLVLIILLLTGRL